MKMSSGQIEKALTGQEKFERTVAQNINEGEKMEKLKEITEDSEVVSALEALLADERYGWNAEAIPPAELRKAAPGYNVDLLYEVCWAITEREKERVKSQKTMN